MDEKHLNRLALQQYHEDVEKQGELMLKLTKAMEALNSKEININLPDNLRVKHDAITKITGDVKAVIANAVSIDNLDDLAKHLEAILAATKANQPKAAKTGPVEVKGIADLIEVVKELAAKDYGITKVKDQVVVFPKQAREALPVRLVMAGQDKFYNASFAGGNFSAPDNVGVFDANKERINPATDETAQAIVDGLEALANAESAGNEISDDQAAILNEIKIAIQSVALAKGLTGELRVSIQSGAVTISSGTITTVTTVGTINNLATLGNLSSQPIVPSATNQTAILSNINNVVVS